MKQPERKKKKEDNIKMDLRKIGWSGMDWINMSQGRNQWRALVNMILNLPVT
jgi:hypothetical protein